MKKTLLHITIASLLTLGSLIVLSIVWSLVLGSIESQFICELSFGLLLPAIFAWILVYISKIRKEYMLSTVIPVEFFGYLLGALHTCALYLLFVARDRRKQYKIWLQKH